MMMDVLCIVTKNQGCYSSEEANTLPSDNQTYKAWCNLAEYLMIFKGMSSHLDIPFWETTNKYNFSLYIYIYIYIYIHFHYKFTGLLITTISDKQREIPIKHF